MADQRIDNATFVTGHTRSGTNLLLRLLDGSDGLAVPPGEGKLHILRRGLNAGWHDDDTSKRYDASAVEVGEASESYFDFIDMIAQSTHQSNGACSRSSIIPVVNAVFEYHEKKTGRVSNRWCEKNHNLEFFVNRALLSFSSPKFIVMKRNPKAVWASWKAYCHNKSLALGPSQLKKNLAYLLEQELREHISGLKRFNELEELLDHYFVMPSLHNDALQHTFRSERRENSSTLSDVIDTARIPRSNTDAGCFCWNYIFLYNRAKWAAARFPEVCVLIDFESVVDEPRKVLQKVCSYLDVTPPKGDALPTEFDKPWRSNTSFDSRALFVDRGVKARWRDFLEKSEEQTIDYLCEAYLTG